MVFVFYKDSFNQKNMVSPASKEWHPNLFCRLIAPFLRYPRILLIYTSNIAKLISRTNKSFKVGFMFEK